ncbi:MAG: hypothetical protein FJX76_13685 [Armatimonadetes bacterium]|nr:hypothetical protein [Armatimonadota bacterium]
MEALPTTETRAAVAPSVTRVLNLAWDGAEVDAAVFAEALDRAQADARFLQQRVANHFPLLLKSEGAGAVKASFDEGLDAQMSALQRVRLLQREGEAAMLAHALQSLENAAGKVSEAVAEM